MVLQQCIPPFLLLTKTKNMKTIGVFAGSFNPWHQGHQDILDQAELIFDKVIVIQGVNPDKDAPAYCDKVTRSYTGLLTNVLNDIEEGYNSPKYSSITLIRGLRGIKDLEYEEEQLFYLRKLKPDLKHVFIMCKLENKFISSSAIRTLAKYNKTI